MSTLLVRDDGDIRLITLNRPEARNALTVAMRQELCELLAACDQDPNLKAVIITGTDPAFSSGVDYKEPVPPVNLQARRFSVNPGRALRAMRKPVVSAVNGACVSGALELALSCSFVVASDRARFADTHARLNVVPAWGLTVLLPRAVGARKAFEMSATGNFVEADEAARVGLANHVVAHDRLLPFTLGLLKQITHTSALSEIQSLYRHGADLGWNASLALEAESAATALPWDAASFETLGREAASRTADTVE